MVIPVKGRSPDAVALETLEVLEEFKIQVILLAGYLRLIPSVVVQAFPGRILNIHPALLPAFGGKGMWGHHVHEAVLASGRILLRGQRSTSWTSTTTPAPSWPSGRCRCFRGIRPRRLAARVLKVEHILYPLAADHLCRAVERGEAVTRPAFPGETVLIGETVSPEALGSQIECGLSGSPKVDSHGHREQLTTFHPRCEQTMKKRALLSVSDKTGIQEFAGGLVERGWELLSTGGTARALREAGLPVQEVAEITGHPEMMEGRVKTLHPAVHAGLLARRDNPDDLAALEAQGYGTIDLVAVNLYPFRETVAKPDVTLPEAVEKIDIGGPTMIRSAAKNYKDVWVVVEPEDYEFVLAALDGEGDEAALKQALAAKVFRHVSDYDDAIANFLVQAGRGPGTMPLGPTPSRRSWRFRSEGLRPSATERIRIRPRPSTPIRASRGAWPG